MATLDTTFVLSESEEFLSLSGDAVGRMNIAIEAFTGPLKTLYVACNTTSKLNMSSLKACINNPENLEKFNRIKLNEEVIKGEFEGIVVPKLSDTVYERIIVSGPEAFFYIDKLYSFRGSDGNAINLPTYFHYLNEEDTKIKLSRESLYKPIIKAESLAIENGAHLCAMGSVTSGSGDATALVITCLDDEVVKERFFTQIDPTAVEGAGAEVSLDNLSLMFAQKYAPDPSTGSGASLCSVM